MPNYDTWNWTFETGSGPPDSFEPIYNESESVSIMTEAGYNPMAPSFTSTLWGFKFSWDCLLVIGMQYIINFFHNHRGGIPFYIELPERHSKVKDAGGDSDLIYLVKFNINNISLKKIKGINGWITTQPLEVLQVDY